MWFAILVIIAGMTLLGIISVLVTRRTHLAFLLGFNTMALVTATYIRYGMVNPRTVIVALLLGIYLVRLNWVLLAWSRGTAVGKLDRSALPSKILISVVLTNTAGWAYCLPFFFATRSPVPLGVTDVAALAVYVVGTVFHFGGDWQKWQFKADPANQGKILDIGLWSLCRHPNYFGDFLIYISFAMIGGHAWAWIAPLLNFLQYASDAIPKNERWAKRTYGEAWADYKARTKVFVPFII
jgi:steroid 5-alpha reductase family enzyme